MDSTPKTIESLEAEVSAFVRLRVEESEGIIDAIKSGHIDALVIGDQLYRLESAVAASDRFRGQILAEISDIVFAVDHDGRITYLNPAAETKYGVRSAEVLGLKRDNVFEIRWADGRSASEAARAEIEQSGYWRGEVVHVPVNAPEFEAEASVTELHDDLLPAGYLAVIRDITERKAAERELRAAHDMLEERVEQRTSELADANRSLQLEIEARSQIERQRAELLQRIVSAQEDERRCIARDIHDQLGQRVTVLRLQLASMSENLNGDSPLTGPLELLKRTAMRLDSEVGFLAWEMRPASLDDLGLPEAARAFLDEWSHNYKIKSEFSIRGFKDPRLKPEVETHLYRILQEALNNITKHAGASCVSVLLERSGDDVKMIIEDNGSGFERTRSNGHSAGGLGILGMKERAILIGGKLDIESAPGSGTTVFANVRQAV